MGFQGTIVLTKTLWISRHALEVPFFFLTLAACVFASMLFYIELNMTEAGSEPAFESIPHTLWFMIVTMTTVGYGDSFPNTATGRTLNVFCMIFGILFLSMPLAIIGNNFVIVWDDRDRVVAVNRLREIFLQPTEASPDGQNKAELESLFRRLDLDQSGEISFREFRTAIIDSLKMKINRHHLAELWKSVDNDRNGSVTIEEFIDLIYSDLVDEDDSDADSDDEHTPNMTPQASKQDDAVSGQDIAASVQSLRTDLQEMIQGNSNRVAKLEELIVDSHRAGGQLGLHGAGAGAGSSTVVQQALGSTGAGSGVVDQAALAKAVAAAVAAVFQPQIDDLKASMAKMEQQIISGQR